VSTIVPAARAQSGSAADLLNRPARFDVQLISLERALTELSRTSGVPISFSPSLLPTGEIVTCHCAGLTVGQAVERLLARTRLRFRQVQEQLLIFPDHGGERPIARADSPRLGDPTDGSLRPKPADDRRAKPRTVVLAGRVTDRATGRPIEAARIHLLGTSLTAATNAAGGYGFPGIPAGPVRARIVAVGYAAIDTVIDSEDGRLDVALTAVPYPLGEIVATATGDQSKLELGNAVARIEAPRPVRSEAVTTIDNLLTGRVAGLTVLADNGVLGAGPRVRLRGISSPSLSNDPLIYVDGIRIEISSPALIGTPGVGGAVPSFLNHLSPAEIESIEIVKGPSAATLYGTQAANGVIRIVTRRGRAGPSRWGVTVEQGITQDPADYPDAYFSSGHDGTGPRVCLPYQQARAECALDQVFRRNLMREPGYTPLKTGHRQLYGVQLAGGTEAIRYFVDGELENQTGTLKMPDREVEFLKQERHTDRIPADQLDPSELTKANVRANLSLALGDRSDLAISTGFISGKTRFAPGGDEVSNPLAAAVIGATADPTAASPYGFVPPNQGLARQVSRRVDRLINSVQASWRPNAILEGRAVAGLDLTMYDDEANNAPGEGCAICELDRLGLREINRYGNRRYSLDLGASANFGLGRRVRARTSAGAQYNRDALFATFNRANVFPPGGGTIDAGTIRSSGEATTIAVTLGSYLEQQVSIDGRLFLTAAVRVDRNSAFGERFRSATYPKLALSWILRDRSSGSANTVRLRAAFGTSGLQPPPNAAVRYLTPIGSSLSGIDVPSVTLGGIGNPDLRPERSNELEVGVDGGFLENRLSAELTYYYKRTVDALIDRRLPPSLGGAASRIENLGTVSNQGVELSVRARALDSRSAQWDVDLQASLNRNRLVSLGPGVPPIRGFGYAQVPGYPLFGLWLPGITSFRDLNGDGLIDPNEVTVSDTATFGGSSIPTRSLSVTNTVTLAGGRLRISGLVDYQGGRVGNDVEQLFRCSYFQTCREINDPETPLEEQAKAVAGGLARGAWFEDASFIKLREAAVTLELPLRWARLLRSRTATVGLAARNLGLIKFGWSSWDPELNTAGRDGPSFNHSVPMPPRMFLLRLNLGL
jgi:TonB-dependent SusC/RagA subfamily outer membrane receptor